MEKAKSYEKLKKYQEAIDCYNVALELDDPSSFVLLRVAKCYERLGNTEFALNYYLKTVHEDPLLDKGWIAITDFYIRQKNYQKALYYVNKAIGIDGDNSLYWKRFAAVNSALHFFEEAEYGYRKAFECGDINLDTFTLWTDVLQYLGEFDTAIEILSEASNVLPDEYEIEYRLAGLYFLMDDVTKGNLHLINGMKLEPKHLTLFQELFPVVWERTEVQNTISKFKK